MVEADIRGLYENWFIETCDDWVVPYIGDLLGFQLVHEAGQPGDPRTPQGRALEKILSPRREVAHTIGARRRRGTLALLEELARDVAGWPARAVEFYKLLGVTQALNHLQIQRGRDSRYARSRGLDLLGGAFDRIAHTVDVRRVNSHRGQGRYNIASVGLFVWRLRAYGVSNTPASCIEEVGEHAFTFSALGNNSQLFTHPQPETEPTHIAGELNVPGADPPTRVCSGSGRLLWRPREREERREERCDPRAGMARQQREGMGAAHGDRHRRLASLELRARG